jgi:uncharacterized protein YqhQ
MDNKNKEVKKTTIGGQALIEGIMMLGPDKAAIAVRKPDGEIVLEERELPQKTVFSKIFIIRGAYNLFRQMVMGVKALMFSAEFFEVDENEEIDDIKENRQLSDETVDIKKEDNAKDISSEAAAMENKNSETETVLLEIDSTSDKEDTEKSKKDGLLEKIFGDKLKDIAIYFSVVLGLGLGIVLFILLPNLITSIIGFNKAAGGSTFLKNILEGLIRITVFLSYLGLASQLKDIKRVWQYHGAEHKTIHCYEAGNDLTVENVRQYTTKHPRCGTSFLFFVMVVSILVFSLVGWHVWYINLLLRILLIPFVAGIAYELIKFVGRHEYKFLNFIKAPGLLFQRFTTKEPDDKMIEVAITAFNHVKPKTEDDSDKW